MRARFIRRPDMINNFELGGDLYNKMKLGEHKDPKEGYNIYIKPNALELYNKRISIPVGNSIQVKEWEKNIKKLDPFEAHQIRHVYANSVVIKIDNDGLEIDKFMISYNPNDEYNSLESNKT